ncbi:MAG: hypothetical protein LRY55_15610 [Leadbetterella sp.]|nr:hypothetical protein [Leadbetterella sp.]
MKRLVFLLLILIYAVLFLYDLFHGNADGVIGGIYFHRLFLRIFLAAGVFYLLLILSRSKKEWVKTLSVNVLIFGFLALALEFLAFIYGSVFGRSEMVPSHILWYDNPQNTPYTTDDRRFWGDIDPVIGRWRPGNKTYVEISCDDSTKVFYKTNSYGARDQEWPAGDSLKIAFLGDSFSEAVLVNEEHRLSELLEKSSGITHMNLGILGANPLAYYLAYREIVKPHFKHNGIIVGIYVGNDFDSFGFPANGAFVKRPIYRPFWDRDSTQNKIRYSLGQPIDSYESFYVQDNRDHLRKVQDSVFNAQSPGRKALIEAETNSYLLNLIYSIGKKIALKKRETRYTGLYENPEWGSAGTYDFLKSFDTLMKETGDLPLLFVIIPDIHDVRSYRRSPYENRYTPFLKERYGSERSWVIDLLPAFVETQEDLDKLYIPCDGHWSSKGNRFVFDYLTRQPEYHSFMKRVGAQ